MIKKPVKQNKRKGNILVRKEPRNTFNPVEEFTQQQNPSVKLLRCVLCAVCTSAIRWCVCVCVPIKNVRWKPVNCRRNVLCIRWCSFVILPLRLSFTRWQICCGWEMERKGEKKGQKIAIGFETRRNKTTVVFSWKKKKWLCSRKGRYHRCTYCTRLGAGIFRPRNEADAANQSSNAFFFVCFLLVLRWRCIVTTVRY